jgi:O-antigen ligase
MLLLLRRKGTVGSAAAVMKGFIFGACGVAIVAWIMPAEYDLRLGDENFFNANSICNVCVFAVFFAQYLMRRRGAKLQFVTLFLVVTIVRSLSKTTIVAFLISEVYLLFQDRYMSRRTKLLLTLGTAILILAFWGLLDAYYDVYTSSGNQAETLTGRTAIWSYVVGTVAEHPWIGHGFDSMWNVVPVFGTFEARHAENEVLEQIYCYGVAGLILLGGVYGSLLRNIRRMAHPSVRVIFVSIVFFVVIRGFAEAEPFDLLLPLWTVILISLLVQNESDEAQPESESFFR